MAIRSQTRPHRPLPSLSLFPSFSSSPEVPSISGDGEGEGTADDTLVSAAVSILRSHRSRSRWNFLKSILPSSGISPSESSSIILQLRNNPHLALRFFLWTRDCSLCNHTLSSYSTIIHILARSRLRSAALSLLRSVIRSNPNTPASSLLQTLALTYRPCDSAPFVFDLLIQAYLHSHNLDPALSVLRSLRSRSIHPLTSTANSLLRAAAKLRGSTATLSLYRELVETFRPNSQTFNTLLLSLYRDGRTELNGEILREMDRFECRPNAFTYSIQMAGCSDVAEARRLWEEMAEKGIKHDTTAYNTLIKDYCEAGEVEKGEELYREMVMEGLEATGTTSELLIKGHCRAGNVEAAMLVYEEMKRKGLGPEAEVVDEMLDEMCEKGMVDEGLRVLRGEIGRKDGVVMGSRRRSYKAVIKGFCEAGRMKEAMKLQAEMAGKWMEADAGVYEAFVRGYEKAGQFEMAEKLRKEMGQLQLGEEDC
ncbi:pentatricopeptide repeat-containing protein At2g15980 [Phalaenopsis equestris]|uniref:pentatricopeptide repeat-containing protein At2g15980 n=1 Tax=Phalaenopsis equestris TaxID=78828 RepID=UPI0009E2EFE6|nr:pentatricopeptide repeat-containing protein At2g15980 [Phalaenopsis equestris]